MAKDAKKKVREPRVIAVHVPADMADEFEQMCKDRGQSMGAMVRSLIWDFTQAENNKGT